MAVVAGARAISFLFDESALKKKEKTRKSIKKNKLFFIAWTVRDMYTISSHKVLKDGIFKIDGTDFEELRFGTAKQEAFFFSIYIQQIV